MRNCVQLLVWGLIYLLGVYVEWCETKVEPINLPQTLQGYLDTCKSTGDLTQQTGEAIFWTAMQQYMTQFVEQRPGMTSDEINFFRNTVESSMPYLPTNNSNTRRKRQAVPPRLRKEIRSMTLDERTRYFNALNALKNDGRMAPNVYDVIAGFHSGENIARAHFGPSFPGWHRLYLYLLETFLRMHEPEVTIPFWASVMDNDMADATQSVMWSDAFFGPGVGGPVTGPFSGWQQANPDTVFTRSVSGGPLYTFEGIQNILSRTRNSQILIPTAAPDSNFELQHGAAHVFVAGNMNNLETAAFDPIFFSHHAFVDQIWERFRYGQRDAGIPTNTDYPWDPNDPRFSAVHNPNATVGFFPDGEVIINWVQSTGYSDAFFNIVQYEMVPTCPDCFGSAYLLCNTNLDPPRCVSRTIQALRITGGNYIDDLPGLLVTGTTNTSQVNETLPQPPPPQTNIDACPRQPFLNDINTTFISNNGRSRNSQSNSNDWVYIPIKIVCKRPINYNGFEKFSLYNRTNATQLGLQGELAKPSIQKPYSSCNKLEGDVGKIKMVTYGLNYGGYSEEYAIVDNRLGVSESTGYIPVRTPDDLNPSEAVVAAFDSCGRVCKPYCNTDPSINMAEQFTGSVRVTTTAPLQYGRTNADAMLDIWNIPNLSSCPNIEYNKIPVSFFCEFTDSWVWDSSTEGTSQNTVSSGISSRLINTIGNVNNIRSNNAGLRNIVGSSRLTNVNNIDPNNSGLRNIVGSSRLPNVNNMDPNNSGLRNIVGSSRLPNVNNMDPNNSGLRNIVGSSRLPNVNNMDPNNSGLRNIVGSSRLPNVNNMDPNNSGLRNVVGSSRLPNVNNVDPNNSGLRNVAGSSRLVNDNNVRPNNLGRSQRRRQQSNNIDISFPGQGIPLAPETGGEGRLTAVTINTHIKRNLVSYRRRSHLKVYYRHRKHNIYEQCDYMCN